MKEQYQVKSGVKVNRALAEKWLQDAKFNRKTSPKVISNYCSEILRGAWYKNNGTGFIFDWNGDLRDGQHRALAVVQAQNVEDERAKKEKTIPNEISIITDVIKGVDPESIKTINIGRVRSNADTLTMEMRQLNRTMPNASVVATALRIIDNSENGNIYTKSGVTNLQIWELFKKHPRILDSVELVNVKPRIVSVAVLAALHYLFSSVKSRKDQADIFFNSLITGENLTKGSPILSLRNKFILINSTQGKNLEFKYILSSIIKSWTAFIKGKKLGKLVYTPNNLPQPPKRFREAA